MAIVMLALAIGANTAIFSVVYSVLLRTFPYSEPDRIVMVWEQRPKEGVFDNNVSPADYLDWRAQNQVFDAMAAYQTSSISGRWPVQVSGDIISAGEPERVPTGIGTADFFRVLGVQPQMGRLFREGDDQEGSHRVVVLSHRLWQRKFGADPSIVGRKVNLSGADHEVIGILPASFRFPYPAEMWSPFLFPPNFSQVRAAHFLTVFARLKQGVTLEQAQAAMATLSAQIEQQNPGANQGHAANVVPLREELTGDIQPMLLVLFGAVGFVVLIACANVANLLLARGAARQREVSIRSAMGASRGRLIRQLLVESTLLSFTAAGIGVLLALWSTDAIKLLIPRNVVTLGLEDFSVNAPVLWFTLALSIATSLLFGLLPAMQATRMDIIESLKAGGRAATHTRARKHLRGALVVAEIGLSLVLLAGAGLMVRTLMELYAVQPGFRSEGVLTAGMVVPRNRYRENARILRFQQEMLARIRAIPGVLSAGAVSHLPMSGQDSRTGIAPDGRERRPDEPPRRMHHRQVSVGYFETMGIPLKEGRLLNERDTLESAPVMVINEAGARRYWPGESAVGHFVIVGGNEEVKREVVGVVGDVKHWGLDQPVNPEMYIPITQQPTPFVTLVMGTAGEPLSFVPALREQVRALDADLPISAPQTLDDVIAASESQRKFFLTLMAAFAGLALVLAGLGIYAVMAYNVTQRTHEIGVRMALGAQTLDVRRLIVGEGARLAVVGITLGVAGALGLTHLLKNLLYGVTATDPLTFALVPLLLATVALAACAIPARRAAKVDPMVALRHE
ncbi:MAG: ABC transporter permease [Candidatus Acidiferrales bacterium]